MGRGRKKASGRQWLPPCRPNKKDRINLMRKKKSSDLKKRREIENKNC